MAGAASPYGFRPVQRLGGNPFSGSTRTFAVTTNNTAAIYTGDLVTINAGVPTIISATPTTTRGTTTPVGVFMGCEYVNATTKQPQWSQYLPAAAVTAGHTKIKIYVLDDPFCLFQVQATGAVTAASIGLNTTVILTTAGSTVTGNSGQSISHSAVALTATFAVRIVVLVDAPGSTAGDAYTDCIVMFNPGVHAYMNATGA
jgi:hypothetical protein